LAQVYRDGAGGALLNFHQRQHEGVAAVGWKYGREPMVNSEPPGAADNVSAYGNSHFSLPFSN